MSVALSPDGQRLALAGKRIASDGDGALQSLVQVVDVSTGQEQFAADVDDLICGLAFSTDGRRLAATGLQNATVLVHDFATGKNVQTHVGVRAAGDLTFSPDGTRLVVVGRNLVQVLDAVSAREVLTLRPPQPIEGDPGSSAKVRFSPDGQRLVVIMGADAVCMWDAGEPALTEAQAGARGFLWHLKNVLEQEKFGRDFHLKQVSDHDPSDVALRQERGRAYGYLQQWDRSAADFAWVLEREPAVAEHWFARGEMFSWQGQWDQAVPDYARGLELFRARSDAGRLHLQACVLVSRKDQEGYRKLCAQTLERFVDLGDGAADLLVARIGALAPGGLPDGRRQVQLVQSAMKLTPSGKSTGGYRFTLGMAHYRAGQYREALAFFEQALENPNHWPCHFLTWPALAMCHFQLGHSDESRKWLAKARSREFMPYVGALSEWYDFQVFCREAESLLQGE
jgi:tetratricopeptide (TPR) repeat protein